MKKNNLLYAETEQKQVVIDAIQTIEDARLLNIITRLIYGILKNNDKAAAAIIEKAAERAKNEK